jgi:hypothetical protein
VTVARLNLQSKQLYHNAMYLRTKKALSRGDRRDQSRVQLGIEQFGRPKIEAVPRIELWTAEARQDFPLLVELAVNPLPVDCKRSDACIRSFTEVR